ncbi:MAG: ANTAR domain-containing protein [Acidimicrobiales bacterium]
MPDDEGVAASFAALARFFVHDGTLGDTLLRVAQLACQAAPAGFAGITMLVEGKPRTGVYTDPTSPELDENQYITGAGPCLDAFRHREVFRIDSTLEDTRWPDFARAAAAAGIHSTLSVPLMGRDECLGALNLYAHPSHAFGDKSAERVQRFADHASIVLVNAQVYWDARLLSENLTQAMNSRATIDYAIGIVMAAGGHSPEEAFQILARASQRENRKLREIAADIVERASKRETQVFIEEPQARES